MNKLIRFWVAFATLATLQLASPAFAGFTSLFLSIRLDVATTPAPAVQPVVTGDFTYSIACNLASFATPASTITLTAGNGPTPVSAFGNATSTALTGFPNDCTYHQISRPAAPNGFIWVGTPPDVVQTGINGEAPSALFTNTLTQAFTITTVATPPAGGSVSCTPNPVPSGQTSSCIASVNSGYTFAGFSTNSCGAAATSNPYITSTLAADCTVTGTFTLTPINGACGSANTLPTATAPTANLCAVGTASSVGSSVSQFTWTCAGNATGTTANCAAPRTYSVTSSVSGGNGTITPASTQAVASGAQPAFTLAPSAGYSATVSGTCGGTLVGNMYTASAVVADCTVIASFTLIPVNGACGSSNTMATGAAPSTNLCSAGAASAVAASVSQFTWSCAGVGSGTTASCAAPRTYTVTSSVSGSNGTITPASTQTVASGARPSFAVAPSSGFSASVGGTCTGALVGNTFTTSAVAADCTVIASFTLIPVNGVCGSSNAMATGAAPSTNLCSAGAASAVASGVSQFTWSCAGVGSGITASCAAPRTYTVTSSVSGGNGTISPASVQTVASGAQPTFAVVPSTGYSTSVGGTCGGNLVGTTYTASAIVANCTVIATFSPNSFAITTVASPANGGAVVCTPNPVSFGATSSCVATPAPGYVIAPFLASAAPGPDVKAISPAASGGISGCGGAGTSTNPFITAPITAACTVTANFVLITVPVSALAVSANGGSVNCVPNPVTYGSTSTCTATANAGFTLTSISGCGGTTTTTSPFVTGAVTAPCTVTANFTPVAAPVVTVPVPALGGWALLFLVLLTGVGGGAYVFSVKRQ